MDKAWKQLERLIAKKLNGKRVPVSGRERGYAPDVDHDIYSIEVKLRQSVPKLVSVAMDQAIKSIKGNKIPLVVIKEKGQTLNNAYVVMRWKDWYKDNVEEKKDELEIRCNS